LKAVSILTKIRREDPKIALNPNVNAVRKQHLMSDEFTPVQSSWSVQEPEPREPRAGYAGARGQETEPEPEAGARS
jgi:hypothetical protein